MSSMWVVHFHYCDTIICTYRQFIVSNLILNHSLAQLMIFEDDVPTMWCIDYNILYASIIGNTQIIL